MITKELAERAISKLTTATAYAYFFDNLKSADWIDPLMQASPDIFKKPISAIQTKDGWMFPSWPEARYLARVAEQAPDKIINIILAAEMTDNCRVHDDFLEAILKIPIGKVKKVIPKILMWLDATHFTFLHEKSSELAVKLAEARDCENALKIIDKVLDLKKVSVPYEPTKFKVIAKYNEYSYQEILTDNFLKIVSSCGLPAINIVNEKLKFVLDVEKESKGFETDYSYMSRPAIEKNNQNSRNDVKNYLIDSFRDSYFQLLNKGINLEKEINELLKSDYGIIHRTGLYLLSHDVMLKTPLALSAIKEIKNYTKISTWHEFSILLKRIFPTLNIETRKEVLDLISIIKENDDDPKYSKLARHRVYTIIKDSLTGEEKVPCEKLEAEFGTLEHPDFHAYSHGASWSGPQSPITIEDLSKKTIDEIIVYLKNWKPVEKWFSSTPEGLGRIVEDVVKDRPDQFLDKLVELQSLQPIYSRSIVQGLQKTDKKFNWPLAIDLCDWIVKQPAMSDGKNNDDNDPDFRWARSEVVRLIEKGFQDDLLDIKLRDRVWKILEILVEDLNPDEKEEDKYLTNRNDYYHFSLNHTRGKALHCVVEYALWLKRKLKIADGKPVFQEASEVEKILNAHLKISHDPALSIRAVYGRWLPWLVLLDADWVKENIQNIFPEDKNLSKYREAAWNTYVVFCGAYSNVYEIIRNIYDQEVDNIPTIIESNEIESRDPVARLGEHLIVLYWQGKLGQIEDNYALKKFYEVAPSKIRENTISFIGRALHNDKNEKIPKEILERLMKFWEWRKSFELNYVRDELPEFGWWAISNQFSPDWSLKEVDWVLRATKWIEPDSFIFKDLSIYIKSHTDLMLSVTESFVSGPVTTGKVWLMVEDFEKYLINIKEEITTEAQRKKYRDILEMLVAAGYIQFRALANF